VSRKSTHGKGEKLGAADFATSCNAEAQREFNRAVARLHSFQFNHKIQGFNTVLKRDPTAESRTGESSQWSNPFAA
jgi:hypothetical protein